MNYNTQYNSKCLKSKETGIKINIKNINLIRKVETQTTLDISKEILDQIEMDEHCKVCYIDDQPPLIKIMKEGKKNIITHKFSVGKHYVEPHIVTTVTKGNKTHYLAPTKKDLCHELGNPGECGSYWTKLPKDNTHLDQLDEIPLPTMEPSWELYPIFYLEEGVTRKLCKISIGPYAYGLNPTYVTKPDEDEDSPYLPELTFKQPVIQFNIQKPDLTIRQLAIIGASTWVLLKKDVPIMSECRQEFKEEIAQETWECLTGCIREDQKDASLLSQLHPSNIVLPMTFMEPK